MLVVLSLLVIGRRAFVQDLTGPHENVGNFPIPCCKRPVEEAGPNKPMIFLKYFFLCFREVQEKVNSILVLILPCVCWTSYVV